MIKSNRMRRNLMLLACSTALALPAAEASGATAALSRHSQHPLHQPVQRHVRIGSSAKRAKFAGPAVPANQWGTVTVNVTMQTTGTGAKATKRFTDLGGGYTYHTSRSQFIMSQALPILRQEFLTAQSARIQHVSGASYTSQAFIRSLQAALLKAHV